MSKLSFPINYKVADSIKQIPSEKLTVAQLIKKFPAFLGQYPFETVHVAKVFKYRYASLNDGDTV